MHHARPARPLALIAILAIAAACSPAPEADAAAAPAGAGTEAVQDGPQSVARMLPVNEPGALVREAYRLISGPVGEPRDWDAFRRLFAPGARLSAMVPVERMPADSMRGGSRPAMVIMSVEDYITRSGPYLEREGFTEAELHQEIHQYGNIAQVFSSYVSRVGAPDSEPIDRGINSFQLVFGDGRWWIHSILWDSESRGAGPLPEPWAGE